MSEFFCKNRSILIIFALLTILLAAFALVLVFQFNHDSEFDDDDYDGYTPINWQFSNDTFKV